jgi:hypothetical protein
MAWHAATASVLCVAFVPVQLLVRAAYEGALAHPLIPDPENLQHLTPETLATFVAQNYTGRWGAAARGLTKVRSVELVGTSLFPQHMYALECFHLQAAEPCSALDQRH